MISNRSVSTIAFLALFWTAACNVQAKDQNILVGSIPGDQTAKQMLAIDPAENVDFIRLRIVLNEGDRKFDLNATFGIGKPNTRDFENGGKSISAKGQLEIKDNRSYLVYRLFNDEAGVDLSLIRLNDRMFHVLSRDGRLMSGNGGWNYTLSRETETRSRSESLPNGRKIDASNDSEIVVFAGRTPCLEIARELKIPVTDDCFKLKWKLTLRRDLSSRSPATFTLQGTFRRPEPLEGNWRIVTEAGSAIYRLEGSDGSKMSFLRLDDSLLFLDNAGRLLKGNGEFGYTLDRQRNAAVPDIQKAKME